MEHALEVRNLVHRYGDNVAVAGVDLTVDRCEIVALLGPNGAGKTTLVRNIIGLIRGQADKLEVAGGDPAAASTRQRLGVVQQDVGFPRTLTVAEVVEGAAARAGHPRTRAHAALEEVGLAEFAKRRAGKVSGGQQQRLQLAMGLVGDPNLIVLDEPTVGLDVGARRAFWDTIRRRGDNGAGILVTTHLVDEAAAVADRIVVIDGGRVVAEGSPGELRRMLPDRQIQICTGTSAGTVRSLDGVESVTVEGDRLTITARSAESVVRSLLELDPDATDLTVATASLEEVLLSITHTMEVAA